MRRHTRRRWILVAMLGSVQAIGTVPGALAAELAIGELALSETERTWLQDNPALAEIAATAPDRLREIFAKLADIIANPANKRGGLEPIDEETARLLEQNPLLLQAWRSSPEASADLLRLIRIAAGGGKPRK